MAQKNNIPLKLQNFSIPSALDRARVDAAIHELEPSLSRRVARALAEAGAAARNSIRAAPAERLRSGDTLSVATGAVEATLALRIAVLFEDERLLVVQKPPGLACHGGPLVNDSIAARMERAAELRSTGAGLAHRLDRGSSGLLIMGKHPAALRDISQWLDAGAVSKVYRVIVAGSVAEDTLELKFPLRVLDEPRGDRPKVVVDYKNGQPAHTLATTVHRTDAWSVLDVKIFTGRTHQIRAHMAAVGHPLIGDPRYGDATINTQFHNTYGVARPMLHCTQLELPAVDPGAATGDKIAITAFGEPDFARVMGRLFST